MALTRNGERFRTERGQYTSTVKVRSSVDHRPVGVCVTNSLVPPLTDDERKTHENSDTPLVGCRL